MPREARHSVRRPHPKEEQIHALLTEGHTDAEIHRRTGVDLGTIARRRAAGHFGPATIRPTRTHPRDGEIRGLLATMSSEAIARTLGVDRGAVRRIRREADIWYIAPKYTTPEQKWAAHIRAVDGGHLEWTGERGTVSATPVMRFEEKSVSPAAIAFRMQTGRDPQGHVKAECGHLHCIAPNHIEDEPGRRRIREQLRFLKGGAKPGPICRHGHDQAEHGQYEPDGTVYCSACKREQKHAAHTSNTA